jgi:hypothetical protein
MAPFRGIFTPVDLSGDSVLDTSIIFAMVVYGIVLLVLRAFLDWLTFRLRKIEYEQRELVRQAEVARRQAAGQTWMAVPTPPMPSAPSQVATAAPPSAAPPPPPPPAPPERPWEA